MDRKAMLAGFAAILTTLSEVDTDGLGAPEGIMYAALSASGYSLDDFRALIDMLRASGLVESPGGFRCLITPKGREIAAKIEAATAQ